MNNPFLSDRNIFSKVVNPLKKKPESEKQKKDGLPLEQISRNQFNTLKHNQGTTKNTEVPLTNNYHSYKQAPNMTSNPNSKPSTLGKMSFGKPVEVESETKFAYNNNYQLSHKTAVDEYIPKTVTGEYQKQQNFNINTNDSRPFLRNDYRSLSMEQNFDLASPNQQMKFEQYRKANNYNEYSPIEPQVGQKLEDSQFLNIDAIGDDLNKFLASSKNQQQICKLLGINVQPKKNQQFQRYKVDKQNEIKTVNRFAAPKESNNTATMFYKQKKVQPQIEMYRPPLIVENSKEDKQYVPTFNYVGLQEQKQTFSREEDDVPRFATNIQLNKAHKSEKERESIEVFNYSQVNTPKTQTSLQDLLNEEMNSLAWNGKYRTFLTSSQKIVTFRYKMQPL